MKLLPAAATALALLALASPALAGDHPRRHREARPFIYFDTWSGTRFVARDDAFFHGRGGGVEVSGGQAHFDYDRDYPYDYPSYTTFAHPEEPEPRPASCTVERVRDPGSRMPAEVRVCRN